MAVTVKTVPRDTDPQEYVRKEFGPRAYVPNRSEYQDAEVIGYIEFEGGFPRGVWAVINRPDE